jgi:sulfite exporter TauE/SafE/copper chaperone CopZ
MKKVTIRIEGMHCVSCESLLEKEFGKVKGLKSCRISHKKGNAEIVCDEQVTMSRLERAVEGSGYRIAGEEKAAARWERPDYAQIMIIAVALGFVFWVFSKLGLMRLLPDFGGDVGILTALPLGVAASLSTCLAITGGIVMGFGAKVRIHEGKRKNLFVRAKPHLYFHAGRIGGFMLLGGLLGLVGSRFEYSMTLTGYVTIAVAALMFYMGLNILGIVPSITRFGLHLPKSWGKRIHGLSGSDHQLMPIMIGALTFFLPCGFTQTMQIASAASGSFVTGALIMGLFAVGTMPVLLGIGVGSTYAYKDRLKFVYHVIGVLVLYFALYSFNSGLVLAGSTFTFESRGSSHDTPASEVRLTSQVVNMEVDWTFNPTVFEVKKGVPVVWQIFGKNLTGCSNEVIIPSLGIRKKLQPGPNVVEFTPEHVGVIPFSCWMGMIRGKFIVTE